MRVLTLGMLLSQFVQNIGGIETGIVAQLPWDDFERFGNGTDQQLLLASNGARVVTQHF